MRSFAWLQLIVSTHLVRIEAIDGSSRASIRCPGYDRSAIDRDGAGVHQRSREFSVGEKVQIGLFAAGANRPAPERWSRRGHAISRGRIGRRDVARRARIGPDVAAASNGCRPNEERRRKCIVSLLGRLLLLLIAAIAGVVVGEALAGAFPGVDAAFPYAHVVPKSEDGVAFRFAMVHDVLHERFPRHGRAYYLERNKLTQAKLDAGMSDVGPLVDDLAVGLEFAGDHGGAIRLLRAKLAKQLEQKQPNSELYSTYANLGTFLILGPFRQVRPGNEEDKAILREGLAMIENAVAINPDSHFGREAWQAAIIQYMIRLYDNPRLLLDTDMLGNLLTDTPTAMSPMVRGRRVSLAGDDLSRDYLAKKVSWADACDARQRIAKLHVLLPEDKYVPFDEPTLGIIGMWRLGGGAHPYFAIALGETMYRVNQPYLAWNAFERAGRMAELVWPDPQLQAKFRAHCLARQSLIESSLPRDETSRLRSAFDKELAHGKAFQKDYEDYEASQIAVGKSIDDPAFYDAFWANRPPIVTPPGDSDWYRVQRKGWSASLSALLAGTFVLAAGAFIRWRSRLAARH